METLDIDCVERRNIFLRHEKNRSVSAFSNRSAFGTLRKSTNEGGSPLSCKSRSMTHDKVPSHQRRMVSRLDPDQGQQHIIMSNDLPI